MLSSTIQAIRKQFTKQDQLYTALDIAKLNLNHAQQYNHEFIHFDDILYQLDSSRMAVEDAEYSLDELSIAIDDYKLSLEGLVGTTDQITDEIIETDAITQEPGPRGGYLSSMGQTTKESFHV